MTKSILKGNVYAADFEATVETFQRLDYTTGTKVSEQVYVTWAGLQCIETGKTQTFQTRYKGNKFINALDSFMNTVLRLKNGSIVFFHNLKGYDYGFITWWGAQHGYTMHGRHSDFYFVVDENKTIRFMDRSEEHTSELQSRFDLVCRLLLEKKNINNKRYVSYA